MRRLLFVVIFVGVAVVGVAAAQETPSANEEAARRLSDELRREASARFLQMEQARRDSEEIVLRRLEDLEKSTDRARQNVDRVLLIFALVIALGFFFVHGALQSQQKLGLSRLQTTSREADGLMRDIRRELARPELEHLRVSQLLRRMLRQLRTPGEMPTGGGYLTEVRKASHDPYLPTALHFIARALVAEHDGNWNIAVQMLEQLREMDAKDADVLLHLSHVHKKISEKMVDAYERNRHQRLAYQYYSLFTSSLQAEALLFPGATPPPPSSDVVAADKPSPPLPPQSSEVIIADKPDSEPEMKKNVPSSPAAAAPAATKRRGAPPKEKDKKLKPPAVKASGDAPPAAKPENVQQPPAKEVAAPPKEKDKELKPPAIKTSGDAPPVKPENAQQPPAKAVAAPSPKPEREIKLTRGAAMVKRLNGVVAAVKQSAGGDWSDSIKRAGGRVGDGAAQALAGLRGVKSLFKQTDNAPLPFLPAPPLSEVPTTGDAATIQMWKEVRQGDQIMARATTMKSLRDRNRLIDRAITCYAQAQSHKTNKTLYHNWGIALLAKALHVAEKKRAPFYNAAVDKFLAGNVVSPHYFDFYLASLYAIIGNKQECLRWLEKARESGKLDADSLMQAPDFDAVRNEPWFDQFLRT